MKDFLQISFIVLLFASIIPGLIGGLEMSVTACDPPFSKRHQYIFPTNMISCPAARWIQELEVYKD